MSDALIELSRGMGSFLVAVLLPAIHGNRELAGCREVEPGELEGHEVVLLLEDGPVEFPDLDPMDYYRPLCEAVREQVWPGDGHGFSMLPAALAAEVQSRASGIRVFARQDGAVPMRHVDAMSPDERLYAPELTAYEAVLDALTPEVEWAGFTSGFLVDVRLPTGELPPVEWGEPEPVSRRGVRRPWARRPFSVVGEVEVDDPEGSTAEYRADGELVYSDGGVLVSPLKVPTGWTSWLGVQARPMPKRPAAWRPTAFLPEPEDQIHVITALVLPDAARRVPATGTVLVPTRQGLV